MNGHFKERLHEIGPGDHVCLVYEHPAEQTAAVVPFIKMGLNRRERCLYVADDQTIDDIRRALHEAGVEVFAESERGALWLMTKRDAYLRFGRFDPDEMVTFLGRTTETTRADGFAALRITGEMTWALGPEVGCERLIEYEVALNRFFPGSHALAVCQYHRHRFAPPIIRDVLRTHPIAILGNFICSNAYYEPPDIIMGGGDDTGRVEWMIGQLKAASQAEERLIQQAEQLAQSNADFEQFAYVASHDLREPVRTTATYAQLLAKKYGGHLDSEAHTILGYIVEGAHRMESLVRDLLTYANMTAPGVPFVTRPVDMNRALAASILPIRELIDESGALITHESLPGVRGNESQIVQLLQNLIENGVKYRRPDELPRIRITAHRQDGTIVFAMQDNGLGILPQYQAQIFRIFKRLGRTTSGTGIGLAICQRIVERHGGRIWVESDPGSGSTFLFTLPAE